MHIPNRLSELCMWASIVRSTPYDLLFPAAIQPHNCYPNALTFAGLERW